MTQLLTPVLGPGTFGGTRVRISPYVNLGNGSFTSKTGTGQSDIIQIDFSKPVSQVTLTCLGANFPLNFLRAYDQFDQLIGEMEFESLRNAWVLQFESTKSLQVDGIVRVRLVPAKGDFVGYKDLFIQSTDTVTHDQPTIRDQVLRFPIQIRTIRPPTTAQVSIIVTEDVQPAVPTFARTPQSSSVTLQVNPIQLPYEQIIEQLAAELTTPQVTAYFDPSRALKTLLNFGHDYQALLTNWTRDPNDPSLDTLLVKLYQPLPVSVSVKDLLWISRELSPTLLDQIAVVITPAGQVLLFLRPPNAAVNVGGLSGIEVTGATLRSLVPSGSIVTSPTDATLADPVLQELFTTDLSGVDLNVDYTDYNHFVHFSSAEVRLQVFKEKLTTIEDLNRAIGVQVAAASASVAYGGIGDVSGTTNFRFIQDLLEQRQGILRGFDGYESFLYYDSGSFSGSLSGQPEDPVVVVSDVSWPKDVSGSVRSVTSSQAVTYFAAQSALANEYDLMNGDALVNNLPQFIQFDTGSAAFLLFTQMVGHHFDLVKLYIDAMPQLYDRLPDPAKGLSKELLWHVAQSLGIDLPNQYALKSLVDFAVGQASATQKTYQDAISETWKRFLHNQVFIAKSKGTKQALQTLLNAYGILPEVVRIRESVTPLVFDESGSFEDYSELTHVLALTSGAHLTVLYSSSLLDPSGVEVRFAPSAFVSATVLTSTAWSIVAVPTGSTNKGTVQLKDGAGTTLLTSPVFPVYDGEFTTVLLRRNATTSVDFAVKRFSQGVFDLNYGPVAVTSGSLTGSWNTPATVQLGGAYSGAVDEFRVWLEATTNTTFDNHVKFPGMYAGNTDESARDALLWRHSMVIPRNLGATGSLPNDSPFIAFHTGAVSLTSSTAVGFSSVTAFPYNFTLLSRAARRFVLNAGGSQFATDTIRIAPPATFDSSSLFLVTGSTPIPVLHRDRSIRSAVAKQDDRQTTPRIGFYLTLAESINDSILRSVGEFDLNQLIGDPRDLYRSSYPDLLTLYQFYRANYSPTFNYNTFITFAEGLLDGLFAQAKSLVPARADLLTGVVIEPTVLERNRVVLSPPPNLAGANTRNEKRAYALMRASGSFPDARNVDFHIEQTASTRAVTADVSQLEVTIDHLGPEAQLRADTSQLDARVVQTGSAVLTGASLGLTATVDVSSIQAVQAALQLLLGAVNTADVTTVAFTVPMADAFVDIGVLIRTQTAAELVMDFLAPQALPSNDLTSPAGNTFFTHPSGSFGVLKFTNVRVRESTITDRGNWVKGTVYTTDDVVTQLEQSGSASNGDGKQFRCLSEAVLDPTGARVPFVSYLAPSTDRRNWVGIAVVPEAGLEVRKAIVSGSTVAIVPFTTAGTPFIGYAPTHYRFFRDQSLRYRRPRFIGCLQTADTTPDGKSPVEVNASSQAQLFVTQGTPVQPPNDQSGPILTVR